MSTRRVQGRSGTPSGAPTWHDRLAVELPPLLADPTLEAAERWATRVLSGMRRESRRICGGWPGTITEARALVADDLLPHLKGKSLEEFERIGHDRVTRFLYQGARQYWSRREDRRAEDGA